MSINGMLLAAFCLVGSFAAGFGWGQWWAERNARIDKGRWLETHLSVSMPMRRDTALDTLGLLRELVAQVEMSDPERGDL